MKTFEYIDAATLDEAVAALGKPGARIMAGGTDILGALKDEVVPDYPSTLVDLSMIPGLAYIQQSDGLLRIGALTRIADIASDSTVESKYAALSRAARLVGSPQIREMGTIAGNICQLSRCWYFRSAHNRFFCLRKGGRDCPAATGDSRYHSIFGRSRGCLGVNPSDLAPVLVALDAKVQTTKRTITMEGFFQVNGTKTTVLDDDEIVSEIQIPVPDPGAKSAFAKYALRKAIDFPIVNCAVAVNGDGARICLNGVYATPYRSVEAEKLIADGSVDEAIAEAAGEAAMANAQPLEPNRYKVQIARTLVKRAILACK
jgi:xanthine dehydrogenase YagS FAD-binding subunit